MKTKLLTLLTLLWMSLAAGAQVIPDTLLFVFKLHGQTRRFEMSFEEKNDTVSLIWGIERKLKWLSGTYTMMPENVENGSSLSFLQPEDKNHVTLPAGETVFCFMRARPLMFFIHLFHLTIWLFPFQGCPDSKCRKGGFLCSHATCARRTNPPRTCWCATLATGRNSWPGCLRQAVSAMSTKNTRCSIFRWSAFPVPPGFPIPPSPPSTGFWIPPAWNSPALPPCCASR